jgi:hypothetical protein
MAEGTSGRDLRNLFIATLFRLEIATSYTLLDSIFGVRKKKLDERGGFNSRIVLELPDAT